MKMMKNKIIEILQKNSQKFHLEALENAITCVVDWNYDLIATKIMLAIKEEKKPFKLISNPLPDIKDEDVQIGSTGAQDKKHSEK